MICYSSALVQYEDLINCVRSRHANHIIELFISGGILLRRPYVISNKTFTMFLFCCVVLLIKQYL